MAFDDSAHCPLITRVVSAEHTRAGREARVTTVGTLQPAGLREQVVVQGRSVCLHVTCAHAHMHAFLIFSVIRFSILRI